MNGGIIEKLNYKYVLSVFEADSNGDPAKKINEFDMRKFVEISDNNGKILFAPQNNFVK